MKKSTAWKIGLFFLGSLVLTGCTRSFATVQDKANVLNTFANTIVDKEKGTTNFDVIVKTVNDTGNYYAPTEKFFDYVEKNVAQQVKEVYGYATLTYGNETKKYDELTIEELLDENSTVRQAFIMTNEYALTKYAKATATSLEDLWSNYDMWMKNAVNDGLSLDDIGSTYYYNYFKTQMNTNCDRTTAFITPEDGIFDGLKIEGKSWGDAFHIGPIEGLLVWPISAMLYYFTQAFSTIGVWGTVLSIFLVTLIVRGVLLLATFKQTMSQQRMTELQPELAKIQQKYPNANTNKTEQQRLGQEQMELYKRNKVNPFGMFIVLIFQFPIFIAVWGAMSGSAILRTGHIAGLQLSAATGSSIFPWHGWSSGVALIIFIIMAISQAVSMLLPQYLQKRRAKKIAKLAKNPTQDANQKTMKIMNIVMLVMIIFMGFSLPVAMAIYWIISAIISLAQSLIMSSISNNKKKKGEFMKYKTK